MRETRKAKLKRSLSLILPITDLLRVLCCGIHLRKEEFSVAFSFSGTAFLSDKLSTWRLGCRYVFTCGVKYRYILLHVNNEWNIGPQNAGCWKKWNLKRGGWPLEIWKEIEGFQKSLGSGLWILVKIKPLKYKDSFRVLGFVHFQWLQQKLRQCIPLLKGYNLRMIVWNFEYYTDSETNLMWKCGCTHTQNGFHTGDTWSCALPIKFLRFVWVGSAVSMLCWVYTPIVQCVPHTSEEAWNLGCKTKQKSLPRFIPYDPKQCRSIFFWKFLLLVFFCGLGITACH